MKCVWNDNFTEKINYVDQNRYDPYQDPLSSIDSNRIFSQSQYSMPGGLTSGYMSQDYSSSSSSFVSSQMSFGRVGNPRSQASTTNNTDNMSQMDASQPDAFSRITSSQYGYLSQESSIMTEDYKSQIDGGSSSGFSQSMGGMSQNNFTRF